MMTKGRVRKSALGTAFVRPEAAHQERSVHRALAEVCRAVGSYVTGGVRRITNTFESSSEQSD
jgi:hypothetical protein